MRGKKISTCLCASLAIFVLIVPFLGSLQALSSWHTPSSEQRYNEVCFLASHNSYASARHGYWYAQQTLTLKEQLDWGIRGLMLDIHEENSNSIILCHRNPFITRCICRGKKPMSFQEALATIREFLKDNPQEIITIFLENYVRSPKVLDAAFDAAGLGRYILKPSSWNPCEKDGWPTLGWLQDTNNRLIVFNPKGETHFTFNQWQHIIENQWGALSRKHACRERPESKRWHGSTRYLFCLNYFPRLNFKGTYSYRTINAQGLDALMAEMRNIRSFKGRMPNFLCLDFIDQGDGMKRVNDLNQR